jgi:recombination protein RecT
MAKTTDVALSLKKTPAQTEMGDLLKLAESEFRGVLPSHLNATRLMQIMTTAMTKNPKLATCTKASFIGALLTAAELGLEPINGQCHLIPFNNFKTENMECQFIIGFKGLKDLFYRHKDAGKLETKEVYFKDKFKIIGGTKEDFMHEPCLDDDKGEIIGYYALASLLTGKIMWEYMTKKEILDHATKHSKVWDKKNKRFYPGSPWDKEFDSMARKTVVIKLSKMLPNSPEFQTAVSNDETSRAYIQGFARPTDIPDTTDWNKEEKINAEYDIPDEPKADKAKETKEIEEKIKKSNDVKKEPERQEPDTNTTKDDEEPENIGNKLQGLMFKLMADGSNMDQVLEKVSKKKNDNGDYVKAKNFEHLASEPAWLKWAYGNAKKLVAELDKK